MFFIGLLRGLGDDIEFSHAFGFVVEAAPFELTRGGEAGARLSPDQLDSKLRDLRAGRARKPLLVPHADSRSQDLLEAAALVESLWPHRRGALVERSTPGR